MIVTSAMFWLCRDILHHDQVFAGQQWLCGWQISIRVCPGAGVSREEGWDWQFDKLLSSVTQSEYQVLSETDAKLEAPFLLELRLWHVTLLSSGLGLALVSALCCLVRVRSVSPSPIIIIWCQWCDSRIPRTKSDIEANHKRKALLKQFNGKMKQLNTKDLDDMTYK